MTNHFELARHERAAKLPLLREAYAYLATIPDEQVALDQWTTRGGGGTDCSTVACGAGWLIRDPRFAVPGFHLTELGGISGSEHEGGWDYLMQLFHITLDSAQALFSGRRIGEAPWCTTEKDLLLQRLRGFIEVLALVHPKLPEAAA